MSEGWHLARQKATNDCAIKSVSLIEMLLLGRSFVAFCTSICLWQKNKNLQVIDIQHVLEYGKYSEFAGIGVFVGVSTIFLRARKYQDLWFCSQNDTFLNEE